MQQWRLFNAGNRTWYFQNMRTKLCVDVKNGAFPVRPLQQWDCNWGAIQAWHY
jgi:hypothetical protein